MGEQQGLALGQVGGDVLFVDFGLDLVGQGDGDEVGLFDGVGDGHRVEAVLGGELAVGRVFAVGDDDGEARVAEVLGVGVALGAVAEDGDGFVLGGGRGCRLCRRGFRWPWVNLSWVGRFRAE